MKGSQTTILDSFAPRRAMLAVAFLSLFFAALSAWRAENLTTTLFSGAHDIKHYAGIARQYNAGLGFRMDYVHPAQLSESTPSLTGYFFNFVHPWVISVFFRLFGEESAQVIFYTTAFYFLLAVPFAYLALRQLFPAGMALVSTALLFLSPAISKATWLGLTEPLMFALLPLTIWVYLRDAKTWRGPFLTGVLLGVLYLLRNTGMVMLPAFGILALTQRGWRSAAVLGAGFLIPYAIGIAHVRQGDIQYVLMTHPAVEIEHFGGPSPDLYVARPLTSQQKLQTYFPLVMKKAIAYSKGILSEPQVFFGEFWVFLPLFLVLLWRRHRAWFLFYVAAFAVTIVSIVFFWYEPRVSVHLQFLTFAAAAVVLWRLRQRLDVATSMAAVAFGILWIGLTSSRVGLSVLGLSVVIATVILLISSRTRWLRRPAVAVAFGFFFAIQFRGALTSVRSFTDGMNGAWTPFQSALQTLPALPENALVISDQTPDTTWFTRRPGLFFPRNVSEVVLLLERFEVEPVVLLSHAPTASEAAQLATMGFLSIPGDGAGLWHYQRPHDRETPLALNAAFDSSSQN